MKAERSSKKIEKIYQPVDGKKSPKVIHVIKMNEDDEVTVELGIHGKNTTLEGFVGRHDGDCYAVYFADALRELRSGFDKVPSVLSGIIRDLGQAQCLG